MPSQFLALYLLATLPLKMVFILLNLQILLVMFNRSPNPIRFAKTFLRSDETPTVGHLAFSLADLDAMRRQGKPISVANAERFYYDGNTSSSMEVPFEMRRGCDLNDYWNQDQQQRKTISKLKLKNVQNVNQ